MFKYMVGYIYLITDTTNDKKYVGQHHYHKEELDPSYHGSGVIISKIYKKRHETLKEEYIKTCYSEEEMCSDEQYYIKVFDTLYPNGYNLTEGGEGGIPCEETRKKIGEANKGRTPYIKGKHHSDETRKKISKSHKGKHLSEETKKKLSDINKGKHPSEETKKKLSESHSGEKNHFFGKHHTEETRKKLSDINKGLQAGERHHMFGKHHSDEARKKMSETAKRRFLLKKMQPDGCLPLW